MLSDDIGLRSTKTMGFYLGFSSILCNWQICTPTTLVLLVTIAIGRNNLDDKLPSPSTKLLCPISEETNFLPQIRAPHHFQSVSSVLTGSGYYHHVSTSIAQRYERFSSGSICPSKRPIVVASGRPRANASFSQRDAAVKWTLGSSLLRPWHAR